MSTIAPAPATPTAANAPRTSQAPIRSRRRPAVIGLGAALVALFGLGGAWLATSGGQTHPVQVAASDIMAGHTLTATDLRAVNVEGSVDFAATDDASQLIGKVAASDIPAGVVVAPTMLGPVVSSKGESIFGVSVKPGSYPSTGLQAGDRVRLVLAASNSGSPAAGNPTPQPAGAAAPSAWAASVISVGETRDDGSRTVDVATPAGSAAPPAAYAASGQLVIVLDQRGGD